MTYVISDANSSHAWLKATQFLMRSGGQYFNLFVEIDNPTSESLEIRQLLNDFLMKRGKRLVNEVENTIFPRSLCVPSLGREHLYANFERMWPTARLFPGNSRGTYFERMTHWRSKDGQINQLEETIQKLRTIVSSGQRLRNVYEVGIFRPDADGRNRMGFPCLIHLSFKLDRDWVHLTAVYRNQYYIARAYGNFTGLGYLLHFVATESGLLPGRLTCLATHAEVEHQTGGKRAVDRLLNECLHFV